MFESERRSVIRGGAVYSSLRREKKMNNYIFRLVLTETCSRARGPLHKLRRSARVLPVWPLWPGPRSPGRSEAGGDQGRVSCLWSCRCLMSLCLQPGLSLPPTCPLPSAQRRQHKNINLYWHVAVKNFSPLKYLDLYFENMRRLNIDEDQNYVLKVYSFIERVTPSCSLLI